ncbi:Polyketide cyclase / dehydrase and lipid transport [Paracoccus haematequi]|jgi:Predicted integral membrane protein|uniref:Polyketide cyclase / dehydrase and lipid transport n=1 Tax=Paracoccus haematequi TaxID=2491866 RepID=A0A447IQJ0_9RHOB|nr:SRPBCC family protein [Paracoccus haematequi]VDS09771.1 Polyketide cyclase / dehydrase and lipid transport [Paracoccus haematequi]
MPRRSSGLPVAATVLALSIGAGLAVGAAMKSAPRRPPDSAPGRTARRSHFGGYQVAGRTVTIDAPRSRIFQMWRDPNRLTDFMEGLAAVQVSGDSVTWVVQSPDGRFPVETRLVEERPDEALAWRSAEGADIQIEAKVQLRDAPAGRGTEVEAHVAWRPQGGIVGHWAAMLRGTDPAIRGKQDLKRLKMLLETGEIATSANRKGDD